jgi:serine protease Do
MERGTTTRMLGVALAAGVAGLGVGYTLRPTPPALSSYADLYVAVAPSVVSVALDGPELRLGSGFALSADRVVTARHLVVDAQEVTVTTIDGAPRPARVLGTDARTDLALLEIADGAFAPAVLGRSDDLRVGDTVLAIGNPYGLGHSLAVGVVGNRGRQLEPSADGPRVEFLQLTMPLNPGNSGGPVFDAAGRVAAVLSGTHAQGQAIAFAVPIEALTEALPRLERGEQLSRVFLGARTEAGRRGLEVVSVVPAGPADQAGVMAGDIVVAVDDIGVDSPEGLREVLDLRAPGDSVAAEIRREGAALRLPIALADWAAHPVVIAGMTLRPQPGSGGEVVALRPRSRSEQAGIQVGDVLRTVEGTPVQAPADVQELLTVGGRRVEIVRDGVPIVVQLPGTG